MDTPIETISLIYVRLLKVIVMEGLINALKAIFAIFLIGIGWYSLGYGFTTSGYHNFFFIAGFLLCGAGVTLFIHVIVTAKD